MKGVPVELDKIADVVLNYRPPNKPPRKPKPKRKRRGK